MEDSWINLNLQQQQQQQQRIKKTPIYQEDDAEDVISGPSTASSSSSQSAASLQSPKDPLTASGSTDENLRASFGTLLQQKVPIESAQDEDVVHEEAETEERARRDTIKQSQRPKDVSIDNDLDRKKRQRRNLDSSYWRGFYNGLSVGFSTVLLGIACWKLNLRFKLFGNS